MAVPTEVGVIVCEPEAASEPLQLPEAVQPVAIGEDQEIVVEPFTVTDDAASVSVGVPGAIPVTARVAWMKP